MWSSWVANQLPGHAFNYKETNTSRLHATYWKNWTKAARMARQIHLERWSTIIEQLGSCLHSHISHGMFCIPKMGYRSNWPDPSKVHLGQNRGAGTWYFLINWEVVCTPKHCGGMGAPNLEIQNISVVLRWWWKTQTESTSLWTTTIIKLRGIGIHEDGPKIWTVNGSFFWNSLIKLMPLFNWSTRWEVGNGNSVSFWYDTWHDAPLRKTKKRQPRPPFQRISLCDATPLISDLAPDIEMSIQFTQLPDELRWMWTKSGKYSASSFYRVLLMGGTIVWGYKEIWISPTPSKVKVFAYLLLQGRILTHDVMIKRHMGCELRCVLCNNCDLETTHHLFFSCQYATRVWDRIELHMRSKLMIREDTVEQTWDSSRTSCSIAGNKKVWTSKFMCVLWFIWRHRNEKIFPDRLLTP